MPIPNKPEAVKARAASASKGAAQFLSEVFQCDFACAALRVTLFLRVAYARSWNLVKITAIFETIAGLRGKYASDERLQGVTKNLLIYHRQISRIIANSSVIMCAGCIERGVTGLKLMCSKVKNFYVWFACY